MEQRNKLMENFISESWKIENPSVKENTTNELISVIISGGGES